MGHGLDEERFPCLSLLFMYAENHSARTVTTYSHRPLNAVRQADTFLRDRGTSPGGATTADLLARRMASTAATYHKVLKILYGWLAEEEEIPVNPMAK